MFNRRDVLLNNIINSLLYWLGDNSSYSSPVIETGINGIREGNYYLLISKINPKNILLQEILLKPDGGQQVIMCWSFRNDRKWDVTALEKEKKDVYLKDILQELEDLDVRIDLMHKRSSGPGIYYPDELTELRKDIDSGLGRKREDTGTGLQKVIRFLSRRRVYLSVSALFAVSAIAFIITLFININKSREDIDTQFKSIGSFISDTEKDLRTLKTSVSYNEQDFEFNRRNAYINILRLVGEMKNLLPARKEAYMLIAENIQHAISYGEIIYEMSKLPSEEYQARIFLAIDKHKIVSLSRYKPVFESMLFPVRVSDEGNDGRGFRITDGYMDEREDPLGSGGLVPHFAVDIINVSNISYINYAGEIVRDGYPSGNVESVYQGIITNIDFDDGYGWHIEVKHPLTGEIKMKYPDATAWSTFYAHLDSRPDLYAEKEVSAGEKLGNIGNSGRSTGPHLHFEVRVYSPSGPYVGSGGRFTKINPYPYIRETD